MTCNKQSNEYKKIDLLADKKCILRCERNAGSGQCVT